MTFDEINLKRCNIIHPGGIMNWSPNDWFTAMVGEVGELGNLLKKGFRGDGYDMVAIAREIADVNTYQRLLSQRLGVDLDLATALKFNEVSKRRAATRFILFPVKGSWKTCISEAAALPVSNMRR